MGGMRRKVVRSKQTGLSAKFPRFGTEAALSRHSAPLSRHPAALSPTLSCRYNPPTPPRALRFDLGIPVTFGETTAMTITSAHIPAIVALIAGILILVMPRLLNFIVAIYLICVGLIGLGALRFLHL
jgi:hypothetical protein